MEDNVPGNNWVVLRHGGKTFYNPGVFIFGQFYHQVVPLRIHDIVCSADPVKIYGHEALKIMNDRVLIINNHPVKYISVTARIIGQYHKVFGPQDGNQREGFFYVYLCDCSGNQLTCIIPEYKFIGYGLDTNEKGNLGLLVKVTGEVQYFLNIHALDKQRLKELLPLDLEILSTRKDRGLEIEFKQWRMILDFREKLMEPWVVDEALDANTNLAKSFSVENGKVTYQKIYLLQKVPNNLSREEEILQIKSSNEFTENDLFLLIQDSVFDRPRLCSEKTSTSSENQNRVDPALISDDQQSLIGSESDDLIRLPKTLSQTEVMYDEDSDGLTIEELNDEILDDSYVDKRKMTRLVPVTFEANESIVEKVSSSGSEVSEKSVVLLEVKPAGRTENVVLQKASTRWYSGSADSLEVDTVPNKQNPTNSKSLEKSMLTDEQFSKLLRHNSRALTRLVSSDSVLLERISEYPNLTEDKLVVEFLKLFVESAESENKSIMNLKEIYVHLPISNFISLLVLQNPKQEKSSDLKSKIFHKAREKLTANKLIFGRQIQHSSGKIIYIDYHRVVQVNTQVYDQIKKVVIDMYLYYFNKFVNVINLCLLKSKKPAMHQSILAWTKKSVNKESSSNCLIIENVISTLKAQFGSEIIGHESAENIITQVVQYNIQGKINTYEKELINSYFSRNISVKHIKLINGEPVTVAQLIKITKFQPLHWNQAPQENSWQFTL